jgi:hypothetical protein
MMSDVKMNPEILQHGVEATIAQLHDYPRRIVVALTEDEIMELDRMCVEPKYEMSQVVREDIHKKLRTAQMDAFVARHG